ncbi:Dynein heavy chain 10, axonemal, partial [Nowakowskiella sp. JEL0078]
MNPPSRPRTAKIQKPSNAITLKPSYLLPTSPAQYDDRLLWLSRRLQSSLTNEFNSFEQTQILVSEAIAKVKGDFEKRGSTADLDVAETPKTLDLFQECLERNDRVNLAALIDFLDDTSRSKENACVVFWTESVTSKVELPKPPKCESSSWSLSNQEPNPISDVVVTEDANVKTDAPTEDPQPQELTSETEAQQGHIEDPEKIQSESHEIASDPPPESDVDSIVMDPNSDNQDPPLSSTPQSEIRADSSYPTTVSQIFPSSVLHAPALQNETQFLVFEVKRLEMAVHKFPDKVSESNCIFFLRNKDGPIPIPKNALEADMVLSEILESGYLSGHALSMLEQILSAVYIPIFTTAPSTEESATEALRADFVSSVQKFVGQIVHTAQQVAGQMRLKIPEDLEGLGTRGVDECVADTAVVRVIEKLAEEWIDTIVAAIASEVKKTPSGSGPISEIEFWRERNTSLSTLHEQLNLPIVHKIVQILSKASSQGLLGQMSLSSSLEFQLGELFKFYTEAKDNDSFPSLMNAIRMVWIISRHYNRDERMVPLMSRIAWELANKVAGIVDMTTILREPPGIAKKKIVDAKELLECWSKVRERIEQSGRDQRWEFDRKKLFEQTNYMASRCGDIYEIAEVMEQFYNIFGPELKAVTGDPQQIDEVIKRVEALVVPFEQAPFDIFNKRHQGSWESLMLRFREQILQIEDMAKQFIDASFKKLRSAEGAFDLLQNIKNIKSRQSINNQLMGKWYEILDQYAREVDIIEEIFKTNKEAPPVTKNQPKVAGAIAWSRSLFYRIKKTIVRFQSMQEMLASEQGRSVTRKYITVAKTMREYEDGLYASWCNSVELNSLNLLKANILLREFVSPITNISGQDQSPGTANPITSTVINHVDLTGQASQNSGSVESIT